MLFAFNQATRGKPRMEWPDADIDVNTRIDTIAAMAVYIDKSPPKVMMSLRGPYLAFEEGKPLDSVAYAPTEKIVQGTRAYVDGKLVASVKRKTIPDAFVVPGSTPARFRLVDYVESLGVSFKGARAVELVDGDDVLARVDAATWASVAPDLEFSLGQGSQGHIVVDLSKLRNGASAPARVSALLVFRSMSPRTDKLVALSAILPVGGGAKAGDGNTATVGEAEL